MSYITVLVKALKCMAKTLISCAWIFMPTSSTVLRGEKTTRNCRPTLELILRPSSSTQKFIGPAICRVLEQWETICQFIKDLEKDNTRKLKSINFKWPASLLATGERNMTRVMLEFLRSTVPVFEEFLTVLQTSGPTVHVVYDAMRLTLLKLMRRFVQADQLKDVHGSPLQSVSCQGIKDRLPDGELVISNNTRKYLALLKPDKQKAALLGMRAFWGAAVSHLQAKLPLNNRVLMDLGCLNPLKRERKSTTISIQNLSRKLLPEFDTAAVLDEWKLYQNDGDISEVDTDQRVDH